MYERGHIMYSLDRCRHTNMQDGKKMTLAAREERNPLNVYKYSGQVVTHTLE